MSDDRRVNAAREYLDTIRSHDVATLPLTALHDEGTQLRRKLGQVLDVVADFEATALDQDTTQVMLWGGGYFAPADARTVLAALIDAAECSERGHIPDSPTEAQANRYRELVARLADDADLPDLSEAAEQGPGPVAGEDSKLAAIRRVFAAFDWERDDRQYALEQIDDIVNGDDR